jgi:AraC-like DNA-binding protein
MTEDRRLVEHAHEEIQVIFHLDGAGTRWSVGDVAVETGPGDMLLLNPWERHSKLGMSGQRILLMSVLVRPDHLLQPDPLRSPNAAGRALPASPRGLDEVARAACAALLDGEDETALKARFELLIDRLRLGRAREMAPEPAAPVRRTLQHLLAAQPGELQVADLPRLAGMSRSHFFRAFRTQVGATPLHVVDALRIRHAVRRLCRDGDSIGDIAFDLGFSTHSHFSRFFTGHLGTSPGEYRRRLRALDGAR